MFTFPPAPAARHKTVIEKIQSNWDAFDYFAVVTELSNSMCICELFVSDGRVWWDAKDPTSRITATVASPYKVYAKSAGPLFHGKLAYIPLSLGCLPELEPFLKAVLANRLPVTKKD